MRLVPMRVRRRLKRWRHAREWRSLEVYAFHVAPAPLWQRIRRLNELARIWARRPEHPRRNHR